MLSTRTSPLILSSKHNPSNMLYHDSRGKTRIPDMELWWHWSVISSKQAVPAKRLWIRYAIISGQ